MNIQQVNELIEVGNSLKTVAQSYSELASLKLKKIRNDVEKNRLFYDEITQVYGLVNKIATARGMVIKPHPKKRVSVLLTSNYRFYGSINHQLVSQFLVSGAKFPGDKIIIGKTGRDYLKAIHYFHPFDAIIFQNDLPTDDELRSLISKLQQYEQILVFYSQFKTVLVQVPSVKDITQIQTASVRSQERKNRGLDIDFFSPRKQYQTTFILEPEIKKMLDFFDGQIKILLLEELFLESELSRTASRLIAMDQAQTNANEFIKDRKREAGQLRKRSNNIHLLETIANLGAWRRQNGNDLF